MVGHKAKFNQGAIMKKMRPPRERQTGGNGTTAYSRLSSSSVLTLFHHFEYFLTNKTLNLNLKKTQPLKSVTDPIHRMVNKI
jgi:hypothetical protein